MGCFSRPTTVSGTRIFSRRTSADTQALVYQMHYDAHEATAMILPLPVALPAGEASVRWRNLKDYPNLFDDLERGFPAIQRHSSGDKSAQVTAVAAIEVHDG